MTYSLNQINAITLHFANIIKSPMHSESLILAAGEILPFQAALCVINQRNQPPIYICDSYSNQSAKDAVRRYLDHTYLLNPVYNAFFARHTAGPIPHE